MNRTARPRDGMAADGYAPTLATPSSVLRVDVDLPQLEERSFPERYAFEGLLGEGGMGEVHLASDALIGRGVAMKVVHRDEEQRADQRTRFLREARVQGQLEHPAIVPVYDLGLDPRGGLYFTMKRVRGQTLEEIITAQRSAGTDAPVHPSLRTLITAFAQVCLAVDFAHARGVVHRDLKPSNVMLGDFGEVYVLDWGVAKIGDAPEPIAEASEREAAPTLTAAGALIGTPGYMAPEQLEGTGVDRRSDVYALGAILFELLARAPLHEGTLTAVLASTIAGANARASVRFPESGVAPELEAICIKATASVPEDRYASARELHSALERYLDGDRDIALRRAMATQHVAAAQAAAKLAPSGRANAFEQRSLAVRELGRALALDPDNAEAMAAMSRFMAEPPSALPPEAERDRAEAYDRAQKLGARSGWMSLLSWFLFVPLLAWMGFRESGLALVTAVPIAVGVVFTWLASRPDTRHTYFFGVLALLCTATAIALLTRIFGPFLVTPALTVANIVAFSVNNEHRWQRVSGLLVMSSAVFVPAILEWCGVLSPSYVFRDGTIVVEPHLVSFDNVLATNVYLSASTFGVMLAALLFTSFIRDQLRRHETEARLRDWHFRQLAPPTSLPPPAP